MQTYKSPYLLIISRYTLLFDSKVTVWINNRWSSTFCTLLWVTIKARLICLRLFIAHAINPVSKYVELIVSHKERVPLGVSSSKAGYRRRACIDSVPDTQGWGATVLVVLQPCFIVYEHISTDSIDLYVAPLRAYIKKVMKDKAFHLPIILCHRWHLQIM